MSAEIIQKQCKNIEFTGRLAKPLPKLMQDQMFQPKSFTDQCKNDDCNSSLREIVHHLWPRSYVCGTQVDHVAQEISNSTTFARGPGAFPDTQEHSLFFAPRRWAVTRRRRLGMAFAPGKGSGEVKNKEQAQLITKRKRGARPHLDEQMKVFKCTPRLHQALFAASPAWTTSWGLF